MVLSINSAPEYMPPLLVQCLQSTGRRAVGVAVVRVLFEASRDEHTTLLLECSVYFRRPWCLSTMVSELAG